MFRPVEELEGDSCLITSSKHGLRDRNDFGALLDALGMDDRGVSNFDSCAVVEYIDLSVKSEACAGGLPC